MDSSKILQLGKCCACEAPLSYSKHLNMAVLDLKPSWKYPVVGNFLTNEENKAVGFVCDRCQEAGQTGPAPEVKYAMEFDDDEIIYHPVK